MESAISVICRKGRNNDTVHNMQEKMTPTGSHYCMFYWFNEIKSQNRTVLQEGFLRHDIRSQIPSNSGKFRYALEYRRSRLICIVDIHIRYVQKNGPAPKKRKEINLILRRIEPTVTVIQFNNCLKNAGSSRIKAMYWLKIVWSVFLQNSGPAPNEKRIKSAALSKTAGEIFDDYLRKLQRIVSLTSLIVPNDSLRANEPSNALY